MPKPILMEEPKIIYDDPYIIGVYKPPNMPTQRDPSGDYSLVEWVKDMLKGQDDLGREPFVGLVHRLDRPVPGVIVLAKDRGSASFLSHCFRTRKVKKTYLAVVEGLPSQKKAILRHSLKWRSYQPKEAISSYEVISSHKGLSLLQVELITGRHHQLRIQLSLRGHPIVNDAKYGKILIPHRCIGLLCSLIIVPHPRAGVLELRSPIPKAFPWEGDISGFPR